MPIITYTLDSDGIITLLFNEPTLPVNTMNEAFKAEFAAVVARLEAERDSSLKAILSLCTPANDDTNGNT